MRQSRNGVPSASPRPAPTRPRGSVLLDRDGTINVAAPPGEYVTSPAQLRLLPGVGNAIRSFNDAGLAVVVVTNQRAVARRLMTQDDLDQVHDRMRELLAKHHAKVDRIHACTHDIGRCACRKPQPGLILDALQADPQVDPQRTVMIGDQVTDVQAGLSAGVDTVLLGSVAREVVPFTTSAPSLAAVADWVVERCTA